MDIKKKILIVDDVQMNVDIIKECLNGTYDVYEAYDGEEAVKMILSNTDYSLVILDIFMPKKDGFYVLEQMKEHNLLEEIPVIVSSATDEEKYEIKAIEMGAIDYISKPIEPSKIKLRVNNALRKSENNRLVIQNKILETHQQEEKKYKAVIELTNTAVIEFDSNLKNPKYDDRVSKLLKGKYDDRDFIDIIINDSVITDNEDIDTLKHFFNNVFVGTEIEPLEIKMFNQSNELKWFKLQLLNTLDKNNSYILTINDIDSDKRNENELLYLAIYDKLTGIFNIDSFYKYTEKMIKKNQDTTYVLIRLDIEKFKLINDVFGYKEGNNILIYIAENIRKLCHGKGTYGRVGQDIFVLCIPYIRETIEEMLDQSTNILKNYYLKFNVKVLFGLYIIKDINLPIESMLDRAALAAASIKSHYVRNYAIYNDDLRNILVDEQLMVNEIDRAFANEEFEIFLQPQCKIANGEIFASEALARWNHPEKGYIQPGKFIPVFEKNGLIMRLDQYVWEKACKTISRWKKENKPVLPISVNISRVNIYNPNLCNVLINLVKKYDIDPSLLHLEITESVYVSNPELLETAVKTLQASGFIVLMDDFGSGYSSLNMLKDISVDILKFDFRFLYGDNANERGGSILSSLVRMAKNIDMPIIVEGVETEDQAKFLQSIGCIMAQGFYYYRPMPVKDFEKLDKSKEVLLNINEENRFSIYKIVFNMRKEVTTLMNSLIESAVIVESTKNSIEAIRWNNEYAKIIGLDKYGADERTTNIDEYILPEYLPIVLETLKVAERTKEIAKCHYKRKDILGNILYLRLSVRFLASDGKIGLYYLSVKKSNEE